jgi:hypothetical protein
VARIPYTALSLPPASHTETKLLGSRGRIGSLLSLIAVLEMLHLFPTGINAVPVPWQDHGASKRGKL